MAKKEGVIEGFPKLAAVLIVVGVVLGMSYPSSPIFPELLIGLGFGMEFQHLVG